MSAWSAFPIGAAARALRTSPRTDAGLTLLLLIQGATLFVVIPMAGIGAAGRMALDLSHLSYAGVCIVLLSRRPIVRALLAGTLALIVAAPPLSRRLGTELALGIVAQHELIAAAAFLFNASITVLIAGRVFAEGRVTVHRVRGAILFYLNIAALFAIAYALIELRWPGAFIASVGGLPATGQASTARFTYFSLTTITTTGYGDILPVHPIARTLANLEAVIGQLFPATLLARLVALHLAHNDARVN